MIENLITMVKMIAFSHQLAKERGITPNYAMKLLFDTPVKGR